MLEKSILEEVAQLQRNLVEFKGIVPPHMVQIPLEEYRRYIESTIKGPTVEIPLEEYNGLKMENEGLRRDLERRDFENRELRMEIEKRADVESLIKQEYGRIIEEVKRVVTDSDTRENGVTFSAQEVRKDGKRRQ